MADHKAVPTYLKTACAREVVVLLTDASGALQHELKHTIARNALTFVVYHHQGSTSHYRRAVTAKYPPLKTFAPSKLRERVEVEGVTGYTIV
jgi:hypothetical protein